MSGLPTIFPEGFANEGGLMDYGSSISALEQFRQAASYYFTRFHASSAVPPTDAAGLVYLNSLEVSDMISRF